MKRGLLREVRALSGERCDYCRMPSTLDPLPFQVDHIVAQQHGGESVIENLAWSCLHCNKHKGPNIAGIDPVTRQLTRLFHPRRDRWQRHFKWDGPFLRWSDAQHAERPFLFLAINDPDLVAFRSELMEEGKFESE